MKRVGYVNLLGSLVGVIVGDFYTALGGIGCITLRPGSILCPERYLRLLDLWPYFIFLFSSYEFFKKGRLLAVGPVR